MHIPLLSRLFILLLFCFDVYSISAQTKTDITINTKRNDRIEVSKISENIEAVLLKNMAEDPIQRVLQVIDLKAKGLLILDSNSSEDAFPRRVTYFTRNGDFIREIGPAARVAYNANTSEVYLLLREQISVFNLEGEQKRAFDSHNASTLYFHKDHLWIQRHQAKEKKGTTYEIARIAPETGEKETVHTFFDPIPEDIPVVLSAISRFSISPQGLVNAIGVKDQIFLPVKNGVKQPYNVQWKGVKLNYFSQFQTQYEFIGPYLYGQYPNGGKNFRFLWDSKTGENYHFQLGQEDFGILDDKYQTGQLNLRPLSAYGEFYALKYAADLNNRFNDQTIGSDDLVILIGTL